MINEDFNSILELINTFHNEQVCIEHLETLRWNGKVISPFDPESKVYTCKGNKYKCKNTGKYFNVRTGTMFDNTKIELQKWFLAIWLITSHKKGISSLQLSRDLKITQKTAWFMLHRIRACFGLDKDTELSNEVEIDETYIGGKNKNRHQSKKVKNSQGRSTKDKTAVVGMVERGGKIIARKVDSVKYSALKPIIEKNVTKGSTVYTDEYRAYKGFSKHYTLLAVNHNTGNFVIGEAHTNTIEGFWSLLKRSIVGIYHSVSEKHLQKYIDGASFRYNTRDLNEAQRMNVLFANLTTRTKYQDLIADKNLQPLPF